MRVTTPAVAALAVAMLVAAVGCAASSPHRVSAAAEIATLRWDLQGVGDDLLVTRLDLGEQRRRVRQAEADLQAARADAHRAICAAEAAVVVRDAHGAANGVTAIANDSSRADVSLSYVARDLDQIARGQRTARLSAHDASQLRRATSGTVASIARINRFLATAAATVRRLEQAVETRGHAALHVCVRPH